MQESHRAALPVEIPAFAGMTTPPPVSSIIVMEKHSYKLSYRNEMEISSQSYSYRFRKYSSSWREDFSCAERTVFKGVLVVLKSN